MAGQQAEARNMNSHAITLDLPEPVYERIERAALGMKQPLSQALAKIVEAGLPSYARVPDSMKPELEAMEPLSDSELWRVAHSEMAFSDQLALEQLLSKNQTDGLDKTEEMQLDHLHFEVDRLMLRKSYALLLLKWRGHKIEVRSQT